MDLGYTQGISDKVVQGLQEVASLRSVSFRLIKSITPSALIRFLRHSRQLKALDIGGCRQLECRGVFEVIG